MTNAMKQVNLHNALL